MSNVRRLYHLVDLVREVNMACLELVEASLYTCLPGDFRRPALKAKNGRDKVLLFTRSKTTPSNVLARPVNNQTLK
jgi:hypothetical protein